MIAEHREVRVTRRKSIVTPFAAPELSPVRTVDIELDKGIPGWTDKDVLVEEINRPGNHKPVKLAKQQLEEMTMGTVLRKPRVKRR
ncbi:hypothetical protein [Mycolicibacterium aichiense]|uniref:Uncharacterized protein n=1 Tax=Mycolicibacterium aichiense TaxID=1799 RepID=A0AAD1ME13_9MYCO|nr:hypothetical protein [Mycolicibacterium aichiense]MCV7016737.1 hypothetical protein [Mycolicibacterium aichiense]QFG08056.1 hypothetical protein SEA_HERBERTWM_90 [Mycobacterium phage Herbertwm]BBX09481.1 hypothetical protein MAIC_42840 [Mycolicibacterium aichiense]SUA14046.1 Uncharacterised protein [Mycolicibacterium aichiense]